MRERKIAIPAIVQTAHGTIDTVISAMRAGAIDFVVKPVGAERLSVSIKNALRFDALEDEVRRMTRRASGALTFRDIVTKSDDMGRAIRLGERSARSNIPVLIEGESGVGKELMARAIQGSSERKGKPFVPVNCGALPENLIESILFGHEKGAFTGATEKHLGKFVEASGGTLFLDEIGELPLDAQVKLLRALQEGEVDPVGGKRSVKVDVRLVSATNQNLIELVKQGRFREDLFYRLNVFPITIPPLRARRADVPDLARRFAARFAAEEGKKVTGVSAEALALLSRYDWPGNVRQLENAMFRAVVLCDGGELGVAEFPQIAAQVEGFDIRVPAAPAMSPARVEREIVQGRGARSQRHAAARRLRRRAPHGGHGGRDDPVRPVPLSRTDVRDGPQARHRPLDPLSQDEGFRPQRRRRSRRLRIAPAAVPGVIAAPVIVAPRCGAKLLNQSEFRAASVAFGARGPLQLVLGSGSPRGLSRVRYGAAFPKGFRRDESAARPSRPL